MTIIKFKSMKKIFLSITTVFFIISVCYSQALPQPLPTLPKGWQRIYVKNVGSFDLPPTMEIQAGKYKQSMNDFYKRMEYAAPQLVAQQKGLNEFRKGSFEQYARVMIETTIGTPGEYEKLNFNIAKLTQTEISELNTLFKQQFQQSFKVSGINLKLIEWYPVKIAKVNGMSCFHVSYKRQFQNRPFVLVHMYIFPNYDRKHTLTLSYRLSEADHWKSDYATILKSFRITNVK